MNSYNKDTLQDAKEMFKALGNNTRIKILLAIGKGEKCVHEIADSINQEISNVSHHLRRLRDKKLVDYRKEGRHKYYQLKDEHIIKILQEGINHVRD